MHPLVVPAALVCVLGADSKIEPVAVAPPCRDRVQWPFASTSIWNTPIGSGADLRPAGLFPVDPHWSNETSCEAGIRDPSTRQTCPGAMGGITPEQCEAKGCCFSATPSPDPNHYPWCFTRVHRAGPRQFHNDGEFFTTTAQDDPEVDWVDQGWWGDPKKEWNFTTCNSSNVYCHCLRVPDARVVGKVRLPYNFTTGVAGGNNGLGVVLPDGTTLLQMQPAYRCSPGSPIYAMREGCPQDYPEFVSLLSNGSLGAHGGSGLSAVGGMIRLGELLPSAPPIRHAIKLELFAHQYYYGGHDLNPPTASNGGRTQYVWPATGSDGYTRATGSPLVYNGTNPLVAPGALLAIPSSIAPTLRIQTVPGAKIRDALVQYGGYLVDDTACDSAALCAESGTNEQFQSVFNMSFDTSDGPWYEDLVLLFQSLHVVANNKPDAIGGGGRPLAPIAPPICELSTIQRG